MLKLVLKNMKNSFKNFRKIYLLLVVSQLVSVISIFLVHGIFTSYSVQMEELDFESTSIGSNMSNENGDCYMGELKECLSGLMDKLENKLDYIFVFGASDGMMIGMHIEYHDGEFVPSETVFGNMEGRDALVNGGRYLTEEDEKNANKVIFSGELEQHHVGDMVTIAGTEFEVVGLDSAGTGNLEMPYNSCPDEVKLYGVYFNFKELPTQKNYDLIKDTFDYAFGNRYVIDEFQLQNQEAIIAYRTNMEISIAICVVSALNTCLLYGYLVKQRRKQMVVYGIVGASKGRRLIMNEIEIMLISTVTVLMGFLIFKLGLERVIKTVYESSAELYTVKNYLSIVVVYLLCILGFTVVRLSMINRDKLAEMLRRANYD